jgi:hypothetical protein
MKQLDNLLQEMIKLKTLVLSGDRDAARFVNNELLGSFCLTLDGRDVDDVQCALELSQAHWEDNLSGESEYSEGIDNCALCMLFYSNSCYGCPISTYFGEKNCAGTPYDDVCSGDKESILMELNFVKEVAAWFKQIKHLW